MKFWTAVGIYTAYIIWMLAMTIWMNTCYQAH